ncbi:MAG TPA: hypothetical protein VGJ57_04740 [Nitrospirales bacterium]|jgi:hypothetical protein
MRTVLIHGLLFVRAAHKTGVFVAGGLMLKRTVAHSVMFLLLLMFSACVEIDVSIPSKGPGVPRAAETPPIPNLVHPRPLSHGMPALSSIPGKTPISLDAFKKMQTKRLQTGGGAACNPDDKKSIDKVGPALQQTASWCWAASSKIVMESHNIPIDDQCNIVMKVLGEQLCCVKVINKDLIIPENTNCQRGGWPYKVFDMYAFDYENVDSPLDWDALTKEICLNNPFIYVEKRSDGSKHTVIVKGYHNVGPTASNPHRQKVVEVYDPQSKNFQDFTYEEFIGDPNGDPNGQYSYSHFVDYAQIRPLP